MSSARISLLEEKRRPLFRAAAALSLLLGSAVALLAGASPASASTLTVCHWGCAYTQVAPAVAAAHDGDTIFIGPGTYAGGITIDESVNLAGAGSRRTVIDGGGPVVTIGSTTNTPTVTMSNLTITGGINTGPSPKCGPGLLTCGPGYPTATALGGGIETFPGTTVTILHSLITGNKAVPAVQVTSVVATCDAGTYCQTSQGAGGGIDDWGTMTLIGSQVTDNQASGVNGDGGGICVELSASLSLQASAVTGNSATAPSPDGRAAEGGGISVDSGGSLTINGTAIDANSTSLSNSIPTPYPEQQGGTDDESSFGGGVNLSGGGPDGPATATISNSELDRNSVSINTPLGQAYGGDPALAAGGPLTLQNVRIEDNADTVNVFSSDVNGVSGPSAFEADSNATITGLQVIGNHMTITTPNSDAAAVGAVGLFGSAATMTNSIIADNTATANAPNGMATVQGAGISNGSDLSLTNVLVLANKAAANGMSGFAQGGGIWNGSFFGGPTPTLSLDDSGVIGNSLSGSSGVILQGGGIFTQGSPTTLTNSVVAFNKPDQCNGC